MTQGETSRESTEQDMRSAWFTLDEMWQMIDDGRMTDAHSLAALTLLMRHQTQLATSTRILPNGPAS
jgi:ADP-ribose pyrophosphatase